MKTINKVVMVLALCTSINSFSTDYLSKTILDSYRTIQENQITRSEIFGVGIICTAIATFIAYTIIKHMKPTTQNHTSSQQSNNNSFQATQQRPTKSFNDIENQQHQVEKSVDTDNDSDSETTSNAQNSQQQESTPKKKSSNRIMKKVAATLRATYNFEQNQQLSMNRTLDNALRNHNLIVAIRSTVSRETNPRKRERLLIYIGQWIDKALYANEHNSDRTQEINAAQYALVKLQK